MPDKSSYQPGEPTWLDLSTPDVDASVAFYGGLLGWQATEGQAEFGGYRSFLLDGKAVAGVQSVLASQQPPTWTTFFSVDDATRYAALASEHGATVLSGPHPVGPLGTMTVLTDPTGAVFGTWQPGEMKGAQVVHEEGAFTWAELATRDQGVAQPFYRAVFNWEPQTSPDYTEFHLGGSSVAGCMDMPAGVPAEVPSYWMPYFRTADPKAKAEQAADLGGTVVVPFLSFGEGRGQLSVVRDPHGSVFGLGRLG